MNAYQFFEELQKKGSIQGVLKSHPGLSLNDIEGFFNEVLDKLGKESLYYNKSIEDNLKAHDKLSGYQLFVDGASSGNPGKSGIGVVLKQNGRIETYISESIGISTNNVAEYKALIRGLELLKDKGIDEALVFSDSELVVKQLKGIYKIRNEILKPLYIKATELLAELKGVELVHIPREKNSLADELAKKACR